MFDNKPQEVNKITIDDTGKKYLLETARWTKFLGLFLCVTMVTISAVFSVAIYLMPPNERISQQIISISIICYWLLIIGIYLSPIISLIKFGNLAKSSLAEDNQDVFNQSLKHLRNLFRYIGIMTIVLACLYILFFIVMLLVGGVLNSAPNTSVTIIP